MCLRAGLGRCPRRPTRAARCQRLPGPRRARDPGWIRGKYVVYGEYATPGKCGSEDPGAESDATDDRRPAEREGRVLAVVCRRMARRGGRTSGPAFPCPPSAVCVLCHLCRRHGGEGGAFAG